MSEKHKPAYDIETVKARFSTIESLHATGTALRGAAALGLGTAEIVALIQSIDRSHFYKSMTSYSDQRIWQDVYHVPSEAGALYVKFTADPVTEFLLLSFKEKSDE